MAEGSLEEFMQFQFTLILVEEFRESMYWPMVEYLSMLPWWKRGWVLQEVVVAKRVTVCLEKQLVPGRAL